MIRRPRKVSDKGLDFLARLEGEVLHGYNDSAGHCTLGVGHLVHYGPCTRAELDRRITHSEAMALLRKDLAVAVDAVRDGLKRRISQEQFDACVSLTFNIGAGGFTSSTVLKRVNQNAPPSEIRKAFLMWNKAGGVTSQGLINRREAEARLYNRKEYS